MKASVARSSGRAVVPSRKRHRIIAIGAVCVVFLSIGLQALVSDSPPVDILAVALATVVTAGVGALIAYFKPANPCGWLMVGAAVLAHLGILSLDYAQTRLNDAATAEGLVSVAAWVGSWLAYPAVLLFLLLLQRFPTGRPISKGWRVVERFTIAAFAVASLSVALSPGRMEATPEVLNPMGIEGLSGVTVLLENLAQSLIGASAFLVIASLIVRYRRGEGAERERLRWIAFAVCLLAISAVFAGVVGTAGALNEASFFLVILGVASLPAAMGVAVLRYRMFDIDLLINRTIVYALMTAGVIGFYVGVVGSLTGVIGRDVDLGASLIATAIVAVVFAPIREGLQRLVNRMMFGRRDDPYAVVSSLGRRLEEATTPGAVLPTAAEDIAVSLRLPYVAIALYEEGGTRKLAECGEPEGAGVSFSLVHHGETIGELIVSPRVRTASLDARDWELLEDLARHIGPAAHAVRLNRDLQRSRASLVRTREEERRRLRRDLHDGLGPELAGIALGVSAVQEIIPRDPEGARAGLTKVESQLRAAIGNIRTIVGGLVPPELEHLGLIGALQERAESFSTPGGTNVAVEGDVPDDISAATEVAAYRIALEAMTNAVRHSGARHCKVRLWRDADMHVEIADDGRGVAEDAPIGTGMSSMRERAEELNGELSIHPAMPKGTRVTASFPMGA